MRLYNIQLTAREVDLVTRGLGLVGLPPSTERDEADNLIDYIRAETGLKPQPPEPSFEDREAQAAYDDHWRT
jgi:hypothetical protein